MLNPAAGLIIEQIEEAGIEIRRVRHEDRPSSFLDRCSIFGVREPSWKKLTQTSQQ